MSSIFLTQSSSLFIGPIAQFFGIIMDAIYNFFNNNLGITSLGVSIIVFTIIIRILMLPLAFKQQKSMRDMQKVQPELKKIQEKYKNKKDAQSQKQFQMETSRLYQQHNVNPAAGCLPILVQFPIIMALFAVLKNIPAYIVSLKDIYIQIITNISTAPAYESAMKAMSSKVDITNQNKVIDVLSKFGENSWDTLFEKLGTVNESVYPLIDKVNSINNFFGINLAEKPEILSIAILIPILSVVFQFLSTKLTMSMNSGASQQKAMMYTMPLFMGFIVLSMPAGLGLYWTISSLFQVLQQMVINRHLSKE
jgi:YidC/Oxa1 family membrane protein insertase